MKDKKRTQEDEPKLYSHEWYLENGYDENYEMPDALFGVGDKTRAGVVEYVNAIRSHDGTCLHYVYRVGSRMYGEAELMKMGQDKGYTEETKRYVWDTLRALKSGEDFELSRSLIPEPDFIAITKVIMDGRHLWPSDVSFNEDYTKVRKIG